MDWKERKDGFLLVKCFASAAEGVVELYLLYSE